MSFNNIPYTQIKFVTFTNSASIYDQIKPKLRVRNYNTDWGLIIICVCFALFAFINTFYRKRIFQLTKAFLKSEYASQLVKSENIIVKQCTVLLSMLFLFSFSFFIFHFLNFNYRSSIKFKGLEMYFIIMLCLIIFYIGKLILYQTLAFVFNAHKEVKEYTFNLFLTNQVIGLLLLPLTVLLNYLPLKHHAIILFIGLFFITILFLFRITKEIVILWFFRLFSKSYLFLYLCALEILPLLLIGKFVLNKYQL